MQASSDEQLTDLFLDMLAAEQGAGENTLSAYRGDLDDLSQFLGRTGRTFTQAKTQDLRNYLADLDTRGFKSSSVARRLSSMRHLFRFLLNERRRTDDPAAILSGPKRGARAAEGSVHRRCRSAARKSQGTRRQERSAAAAKNSHGAAVMPSGSSLRHGPARV